MLTRRAVVAGVAAASFAPIPALAAPAARPFISYFPRVPFSLDPVPYLEMRAALHQADWCYQSLAEHADDARGVILHLPTGFAYYTAPDPRVSSGSAEFFHDALCLFRKGEPLAKDYGARRAIGRAAAWISTLIEDRDSGVFYIPRGYSDPKGPLEQPASPLIASKIPAGFLLYA